MASFDINKTVKFANLIVVEQDVTGKLNDTNEFTMEMPEGSGHRLISAQLVATAASAGTGTEEVRVEKVDADGSATTIAVFDGASTTSAGLGSVLSADVIDVSECNIASGESIRFSMDWGAADTLTCKVTAILTAN